jgi:hypothetical protein
MIIVTLTNQDGIKTNTFNSLTEALVFARGTDIGTAFQIREDGKLLAKGLIEDYKEGRKYE